MPLALGVGLGPTYGGGVAFLPEALFAAGEQGFWYDPSDITTLFQDSAGTTPVTATGQPVGKILDKSGRGNHATQATAANRPTWQQDGNGKYYLAFDGTNDGLNVPSIAWPGAYSLWVGLRTASTAGQQIIYGDPIYGTRLPQYLRLQANMVPESIAFTDTAPTISDLGPAINLNQPAVVSVNCSTTALDVRSNRVSNGATAVIGALNSGSLAPTIGYEYVFGGGFFNGNIYYLMLRAAESSASQISGGEAWVNVRTGAY